jgi:hypothetical protein
MRESISAYVFLDAVSSYITSSPPIPDSGSILGNVPNLQLVRDLIAELGPMTPAQIISVSATRNYTLLTTTLNAFPAAVAISNASGLVTVSGMLYIINQTEFEIAAAEYAALVLAQRIAQGYYLPTGGYGNTRYKLVDDDVYLSDVNYGGSAHALLLDASRRELLIGEGSWLKVVDNISLWQSDVATVTARRLVRFMADDTSARFVRSSSDVATTNCSQIAALLRNDIATRIWSAVRTNLPNSSAWPPKCAVSSSDSRSLSMLLFGDGYAWIASDSTIMPMTGAGVSAIAAATNQPGNRVLVATTTDVVYLLSESSGQLYQLVVGSTSIQIDVLVLTLLTSTALPTGSSGLSAGRLISAGTKAFFLSSSSAAYLWSPNYIMRLQDNTIASY